MSSKLNKISLLTSAALLFQIFFSCVDSQDPINRFDMYQTIGQDENVRFRQESPLNAEAGPIPGARIIQVDPSIRYQDILGFGAAMSNSAAFLLQNQREPMLSLFDRETGAGINYIRLPMGGTDFQPHPPYTYNDLEDSSQKDYDLEFFSIDRDRDYIIPVLQEMLAINPDTKIMGSPWTAPAWMKTSQSLNWGELVNDQPTMQAYADYFVRFIQGYAEAGIPIHSISVQNEPDHESFGYPTMRMSAEQQTDFIANYIGPTFEANGIDTVIIAWDHNWDIYDYPIQVLDDPVANQYTIGSAFHCYLGNYWDVINVVEAHPDKDIFFTECTGGDWATDFADNLVWNSKILFISQLLQYSRNVLLWNIALDEHHGPIHPDALGCQDCRGVVTLYDDGTWGENEELYVIKHFGKFVLPGAVRVETSFVNPDGSSGIPFDEENDIYSVAFRNPDGTLVVVVVNGELGPVGPATFSIEVLNEEGPVEYYNYDGLSVQTVATFVQQTQ